METRPVLWLPATATTYIEILYDIILKYALVILTYIQEKIREPVLSSTRENSISIVCLKQKPTVKLALFTSNIKQQKLKEKEKKIFSLLSVFRLKKTLAINLFNKGIITYRLLIVPPML